MCLLLGGFLDELDGHMRTFEIPKALKSIFDVLAGVSGSIS
jgi:hypothetical protein